MKYKIVNSVPKRAGTYHDIRNFLKEFNALDAQVIEIDPIEEGYANKRSMQSAVSNAITKYGYKGRMHTSLVNEKVYIYKTSLLEDLK